MKLRSHLLLLPFASVACMVLPSQDADVAEDVGQTSSPVIEGKDSNASQDAVVMIVHDDPQVPGLCTGTLVAPNLVLTARHCVSATDAFSECDIKGAPLSGGDIREDHSPKSLLVFAGVKRPNFLKRPLVPSATGAKIFHDGSKTLCNHDFALLLLDKPVANAPIAPMRLESSVKVNEKITAVGWGVTETTAQTSVRKQRTGVAIVDVGPSAKDPDIVLPPNEFRIGEAICQGDSGGPGLSVAGAVVGVVSRGGNGLAPSPSDPSASCIGSKNVYTKVSAFGSLVAKAFAAAGAAPWPENADDPNLAPSGTACTDAAQCGSHHCVALDASAPDTRTCVADCATKACPSGQVCAVDGDAHVCHVLKVVTTTTTTGCAVAAPSSSGASAPALALGSVAAAIAVLSRRRRRSA